MRYQGKITAWKDDQGYGFITPNIGGDKVFVHIKSFVSRRQRPALEQIVTYELSRDERGRARAAAVDFVDGRKSARNSWSTGPSPLPPILASGFLTFVALSAWAGKLPGLLAALYFAASLLTFGVYAHDKSAARAQRWRIRESTLHLLALIGGWPGALLAQHRLRHKSGKSAFLATFWTSVLLNSGMLILLLTPGGKTLRAALGIG
ncbi:DUF1294 domain-containing protein [Quatrionicoccus australiensis]|uniref:DUF1294 domain-containing protein n=1 Tax=Quatrionicoccus australiensis TaxID=138118 RepID=UPI001CF840E7|nr:cold shock and DUF1294 domain-containing protein [Quatrionicoccus australiensis]UCV15829.1 cold shock and DUF1294 domain-containing protein [Quatrionicoccus australiensis]